MSPINLGGTYSDDMRMLWREAVMEVKSEKLLNRVRSAALEFDLRLSRSRLQVSNDSLSLAVDAELVLYY